VESHVSAYRRAWRFLAGPDSTARPGFPAAELLAPLPLACIVLLVVNDWVLKPAVGGVVTGKLSDVAGLAVVPLVATAALDVALIALARLGLRVDFSLRPWKLHAALVIAFLGFTAVKLSPAAAAVVAATLSVVTGGSTIVPDPTDLIALPALLVAYWHGRQVIARGSYGRLAVLRLAREPTAAPFADALAMGADADVVRDLEVATREWLAGGDAARVDAALVRLRAMPARRILKAKTP